MGYPLKAETNGSGGAKNILTDEEIDAYRAQLPELPAAKRARFVSDMGLTEYDAEVITQDRVLADYFDAAAVGAKNPKSIANWIISELLREVAAAGISLAECKVTPLQLAGLMKLVDDKVINGKIAKEVFAEMFASGGNAEDIVKTRGLVQVSDSSVIVEFAQSAIAGNPKQVEQFKNGNEKILQYLVGQVMKLSKGKANPQLASEILKDLLSK